MKINDPDIVEEVKAAFYEYERALMEDDLEAMADLFHQAPQTVRYGVGECLYGSEDIAAFRKARGGSPRRTLGKVAITVYGDSLGTTNAEFFRENSPVRGRQSQTWIKFPEGWKVVSAHVSLEKDIS